MYKICEKKKEQKRCNVRDCCSWLLSYTHFSSIEKVLTNEIAVNLCFGNKSDAFLHANENTIPTLISVC